jgi:peptidoglycan-associated lipoprotein
MKRWYYSAVLCVFLTACGGNSSVKSEQAATVEDRDASTSTRPTDSTRTQGLNTGELRTIDLVDPNGKNNGVREGKLNPLRDPANILSKRSVLFDYDSYVVKPEYRDLVQAHAQYLLKNPQANLIVQGNTDDRGSTEYNLALGQKRADSVGKLLKVLGVHDKQVETVSFGKEKPRASGQDDNARAQNRRADFVYKGEQ